MQAGDLAWRLQILRKAVTQNALNEDVETWPVLATVWASKADVSDGERVRAEAVWASITTRFVIRRSTLTESITPLDRVQCDGRPYNVVGKKDVGPRREAFELTAVARAEIPSG
ncbi:phage head closure protein [Phenylobacterium sp.]|jgi:SPP1 family predicted phage head-tail adaptor|uniref:phage head closure protein n=1 Tax=Phenylobacterium sp. TaxID=1871053 RepID=UPI002F42853D